MKTVRAIKEFATRGVYLKKGQTAEVGDGLADRLAAMKLVEIVEPSKPASPQVATAPSPAPAKP